MNTRRSLVVFLCALSGAAVAHAQTWEPDAARLRLEVSNGFQPWSTSMVATPGTRIEYRVVLDYTGTRSDLFALGEALFQPTIRNAGLAALGATYLPNGALTQADGASIMALPQYGRVGYLRPGTTPVNSNMMTNFRHTGGFNGAPPGDWMRVAGSFVSQWPRALPSGTDVTADDINRLLRGIACTQLPQSVSPTDHITGTTGLVLFRGATTFEPTDGFMMEFSTFRESLRRWGGVSGASEPDDRRYIAWQTGPTDSGSGLTGHRTGVVIQSAIVVIPAPGAAAVACVGLVLASRRRR